MISVPSVSQMVSDECGRSVTAEIGPANAASARRAGLVGVDTDPDAPLTRGGLRTGGLADV
ncbi:MAG: hypothetical protein EXQ74_00140 [Thermoleophilia bacterium]|nr:hypothetical protein [Thermoleophilia bacterium]